MAANEIKLLPSLLLRPAALIRTLVLLGLGIGLGYAALRTVDLGKVASVIAGANLGYLLLALLLMALFYFLEAVRWSSILSWRLSPMAAFKYSRTAYLVTSILPFQLGELVKPGFLKLNHGIPYAEGLTSVAAGRLLDLVTIILLGVVSAVVVSISTSLDQWVDLALRISGAVALVLVFLLFAAVFNAQTATNLVARASGMLPLPGRVKSTVPRLFASVLAGAHFVRQPRYFALALLLSLAMWMVNFAKVYVVFLAVGLDTSPWLVLLGFVVVTLGMILPLSPGYIGQYEAFWMAIFLALGVGSQAEVASLGLLSHAVILFVVAVLGIPSLLSLQAAWEAVGARVRKREESEVRR